MRDGWIKDSYGVEYEIVGKYGDNSHSMNIADYEIGSGAEGRIFKVRDNWNNLWAFKSVDNYSSQKIKLENVKKIYDGHHYYFDGIESDYGISFAWPLSFVDSGYKLLGQELSGGYIMKLYNLNNFITCDDIRGDDSCNWDYKDLCNISLSICRTIAALHDCGYSYRDISRDNLRLNTEYLTSNKSVVVIDLDNIGLDKKGSDSYIKGTPGFTAPEIYARGVSPSIETDLFSVGVMLYMIWMKGDPFEGTANVRDWDLYKKRNPVFTFHPTDKSNTLIGDETRLENYCWDAAPRELKDLFVKALGYGAQRPEIRPTMKDWISTLSLIKYNDLKRCPACNRIVAKNGKHCFVCEDKGTKTAGTIPAKVSAFDSIGNKIASWNIDRNLYISGKSFGAHLSKYNAVIEFNYKDVNGVQELTVRNATSEEFEIIKTYGHKTDVLGPGRIARICVIHKIIIRGEIEIVFDIA